MRVKSVAHLGAGSFIFFSLVIGVARAETAVFDPTIPLMQGGHSGGGGGSGGSGLANSIAGEITGRNDPNAVNFTDKEGQENDRRREFEAARDRANSGNAVAIATGAALTATAIPMLASPIAAVRAAGAALMVKAGLEFAQAGADRRVANQNNDSANLLKQKANQESRQATAENSSKQIAEKVHSPELERVLSQRGVNPEDFVQRLSNGEFTSTTDVLKAVGDNGEYSADDLAKGEALADKEMTGVVAEKEAEMKRLGYDESNPTVTTSGAVTKISSEGVKDANGSEGLKEALSQSGASPALPDKNFAPNLTEPFGGKSSPNENGRGLLDMLAALHGLNPDNKALLPWKAALEAVGITKPIAKQNIFQIAHRNFRGFGKWRKQHPKVRQLPRKRKSRPNVVALREG